MFAIMNYSSKTGIDSKNSYEFWFYSDLIRIIGDKPFARGDVVEILAIDEEKKEIKIEVLGDPNIEDVPSQVLEKELPVFMFLVTPLPLDELSDYNFYCDNDNCKFLVIKSSIKSRNKRYVVCCLINGESVRVKAVESVTKAEFEWVVSNNINNKRH